MNIIIFLVLIYLRNTYSFVDLSYFRTFMSNLVDEKNSGCSDADPPKEICDENQIMMQLAKMYIISPERVLLLLASDSLADACKGVTDTMDKINKTQTGCIALSTENLYMKLLKTVQFFHTSVCQADTRLRKRINNIGDCLPELREEFLDCEGAPDWYENKNLTIRCQVFNEIVNCNYVKTALLCGLEPAAIIRTFSAELFQQALSTEVTRLTFKSIRSYLNSITDAVRMQSIKIIAIRTASQKSIHTMSHLTSFILLIKTISNS